MVRRSFTTFVVTTAEADRLAAEYVELIDSKGGDVMAFDKTRLEELLTKQLSPKLQWRDPNKKVSWERNREKLVNGFKDYLGIARDSPFGKR